MSIEACAGIVQRGDPDRFMAAMAAPVSARRVLFPIYAFNVEVARAPWVTVEPLIAQMRLQWWQDALDEIASGGMVRRHEVVVPLAQVLDAEGARLLMAVVAARQHDIEVRPFAAEPDLYSFLQDTGGALMWVAARALGSDQEARARGLGQISALANYLLAVPELLARGRRPLPDDRPAAIAALGNQWTEAAAADWFRERPGRPMRIAERAGWRAGTLLRRAAANPQSVLDGTLAESDFRRRLGLLLRSL